jgi:DNA (cytosine-5)-methyltransferase 3A
MSDFRVLSLFDGISCGQIALERAGIKPSIYMASEIDKHPIAVTCDNYPQTVQLGDVRAVRQLATAGVLGSVDLLMGGSPCQGFSKANGSRGFDDPRSQLLFDYISVKDALKPRYFLLENVRMKKEDRDLVSLLMGVEPIEIDSAMFSAQRRKRLYWTNIPIAPIFDAGIEFWAIREYVGEHLKSYKMKRTPSRIKMWSNGKGSPNNSANGVCSNITYASKSHTLTTKQDRCPNSGLIEFEDFARYLTHVECERLQTLPDNYTRKLKKEIRYKAIGNGWTVDVIAHILRGVSCQL